MKSTDIKFIGAIKPSSPTPHHLQTFKLSSIEQGAQHTQLNLHFFYPNLTQRNDDDSQHVDDDHVTRFSRISQILRTSLSETLKLFYHFAGRFQDDATVICNDEGAVFIESHTNYSLSDILTPPDLSIVDSQLLPIRHTQATETFPGSMIYINCVFFTCGATAICSSLSHKVGDMSTWTLFFKTWSAISRGIEPPVKPDLHTLPTMFPLKETSEKTQHIPVKYNSCMRRFVFRASKVEELKSKLLCELKKAGRENYYPSRVDAVTALIWRCLVSSSKSKTGLFRPSLFLQAFELRRRLVPPVVQNAIGLLSSLISMTCENESELELHELHKKIIGMKGKLEEMGKVCSGKQYDELNKKENEERKPFFEKHKDQVVVYVCTSFSGFGHYEIDFAGMGKPVWVTSVEHEMFKNVIMMKDTRVKGEMEAVVFLEEEDMNTFASNEELLRFAEINPT